MLFIFAVVYLLRRYGTQTIPLQAPTPVSSTPFSSASSAFARNDSSSSDGSHRTVLEILWSCLATTFACTWVSVHPNIPWKGEGKWIIICRRIYLLFFSILAPEFMVMWAFKQWCGARMITEVVNDAIRKAYSHEERQPLLWTTAYGHLLQMGGFILHVTRNENFYWGGFDVLGERFEGPQNIAKEDSNEAFSLLQHLKVVFEVRWGSLLPHRIELIQKEEVISVKDKSGSSAKDEIWEGVLRIKTLKQLLAEGLVDFPTITEDEIYDKSKGDALSKGLALMQLTWFVVQIITRAAQGLAVSELELTTAALAGLNSVMYLFWWSKPRDVRFPVVIRTKGVERILAERPADDVDYRFSFSDDEFDCRRHLWESNKEATTAVCSSVVSLILKIISSLPKLWQWIKATPQHARASIVKSLKLVHWKRLSAAPVLPALPMMENPETSIKVPDVQDGQDESSQTVSRHIAYKLKSVAISVLEYAALSLFPLLYLVDLALFIPIAQILGDNSALTENAYSRLNAESNCETFRMIFYSEDAQTRPLLATSSVAGALFGAVHCLAWHFSFASHVEEIVWKSASVGVVGSSIVTFSGVIILPILDSLPKKLRTIMNPTLTALIGTVSFVYPVARISLLVLAVASLRSLPPSTLDTIVWVELFPHI